MIFSNDIPDRLNRGLPLQLQEELASFVCMVCHELRTPLNILSLSTSLLGRHSHRWTEEEKRLHLEQIQKAVEQIAQVLDEILTISKAEAGKLKVEPNTLNLAAFCCDLVAQIQMLSTSSQHIITFVSQDNCSPACVDKKLLQSILTNLLLNAVKYSPNGSKIDLELCFENKHIIFQIKDRGIGIPIAEQQRLFEPFHRGSNVGDVPGSGLGLAVVKKLVDLHDGQIDMASEVGVGTTFTVRLPLVSKCCE